MEQTNRHLKDIETLELIEEAKRCMMVLLPADDYGENENADFIYSTIEELGARLEAYANQYRTPVAPSETKTACACKYPSYNAMTDRCTVCGKLYYKEQVTPVAELEEYPEWKEFEEYFNALSKHPMDAGHTWIAFIDKWRAFKGKIQQLLHPTTTVAPVAEDWKEVEQTFKQQFREWVGQKEPPIVAIESWVLEYGLYPLQKQLTTLQAEMFQWRDKYYSLNTEMDMAVEDMRVKMVRLQAENKTLTVQNAAYKTSHDLAMKFKSVAEEKAGRNQSAADSLESEREMNATLTEENEKLQAENQRLREQLNQTKSIR